jgi:DNA-directed RNA polymerase specialized sigma24 family protein
MKGGAKTELGGRQVGFQEYGKKWKTQWHAGLYDALRAELKDYKDVVEILAEHPLTDEPERIDALVVKKKPEAAIGKNFARGFKLLNIIEYKSPEDSFSVRDFYKVLGYAGTLAYLSSPLTDFSDMTITVITTKKPVELLKLLRSKGMQADEDGKGFCTLSTAYPTPAFQIIESKRLGDHENLWLKSLSKNVTSDEVRRLAEERKTLGFPVGAYFNVLLQANPEVVKEMLNMDSSALLEVLNEFGFVSKERLEAEREDARRKLEAEREALMKLEAEKEDALMKLEAEKKDALMKLEAERKKTVGKMKSKGFTPDEISDMLDMPLETIREYLNEEA